MGYDFLLECAFSLKLSPCALPRNGLAAGETERRGVIILNEVYGDVLLVLAIADISDSECRIAYLAFLTDRKRIHDYLRRVA